MSRPCWLFRSYLLKDFWISGVEEAAFVNLDSMRPCVDLVEDDACVRGQFFDWQRGYRPLVVCHLVSSDCLLCNGRTYLVALPIFSARVTIPRPSTPWTSLVGG